MAPRGGTTTLASLVTLTSHLLPLAPPPLSATVLASPSRVRPPRSRSFPVLIPVEASGFATLCYETRLPTTSRTCALAAALARPSPAASPAASKAPRDNRATAVASLTPFPKGGELDWRAGERAVIGKGDGHPAGCPRWFNRAREFRTKEQDGTARKQWLLHSRHAAPWSPTLNLVERGGASSRRE